MKRSQAFERLIEMAVAAKSNLVTLKDLYVSIQPVIEKEHEAIRSSDMRKVAEYQEKKSAITDQVELEFSKLQTVCRELVDLKDRIELDYEENTENLTMSEMLHLMAALGLNLAETTFARQVLDHQIAGVQTLIGEFDDTVKTVQPLLEMNMYVVSEMLHNVQRSYQFHMSLVSEEESSYTDRGVKNSRESVSGFKARV